MQNCPPKERLSEYVQGRLQLPAHEHVDRHLAHCQRCCAMVETFDSAGGTLADALRGSRPAQPGQDQGLRELVELAKRAGRSDPGHAFRPGDVLGNYHLQDVVGSGGMGTVFRAYHRRMKRDVAIKAVSTTLIDSEAARQRFQREVEAAARLSHPHIVSAYDAGEWRGTSFLVLEYVEGTDLAQVVTRSGPLTLRRALRYSLQAAEGLSYAHQCGVVHRDVKPANLMLTNNSVGSRSTEQSESEPATEFDDDGMIKILDMGLARIRLDAASTDSDLSTSRAMMGTAAFMAPEQALNPRQTDHRADIYGLGCTLFYLLTGRHVFQGETMMEVLLAHREQPIPKLSSLLSDCPPQLDSLLRSMLAKEPDDRPQSMRDVIGQLRPLAVVNDPQPPAGPRRRLGRRPLALVAAAAVLLIAVAAALLWEPLSETNRAASRPATRSQPPSPPPRGPAIAMVRIPAGRFLMGAAEADVVAGNDQRPRHPVRISKPFLMSKHEITRAEFREVMGAGNASGSLPADTDSEASVADQRPISGVNWLTAVEFCNRLSRRHGLDPYYEIKQGVVRQRGGNGFHLPTEAQWEYACRAGSDGKWHFGDDTRLLDQYEWHANNSDGTPQPVGRLKPNAWGLHDMHGNVPEWCWDRYDPNYYKTSPEVDPPGSPQGQYRVFRGGSASYRATQTTAGQRAAMGDAYGAGVEDTVLLLSDADRLPGSQGVGIRVVRKLSGGGS